MEETSIGTGFYIEVYDDEQTAKSETFVILPTQPKVEIIDIFEGQPG